MTDSSAILSRALDEVSPGGELAIDGATFALDAPDHISAVWGTGTSILWAEGEPLMIYGPDGVGKTTLAQQLVLRRIGVGPPELLGHQVAPGKVLYLALDRPKQAARSMRRMVSETDRATLRDRLTVWRGTPPFDVISQPDSLLRFAHELGVHTVVIDSLKDLAPKLSDEEAGTAIHRAWQRCVEAGIEVLTLHHPRKAQADNKKPRTLADVYGSHWLTAGCGSVLLLWGEAGDPIVGLEHLKQPADQVGPLTLLHSQGGQTSIVEASSVVRIVEAQSDLTSTAQVVARVLFDGRDTPNEVEKARRRLEAEVRRGHLERLPADPGQPVRYRVSRGVTQEGHARSRDGSRLEGHGAPHVVGARDPSSQTCRAMVTKAIAEPDSLVEVAPLIETLEDVLKATELSEDEWHEYERTCEIETWNLGTGLVGGEPG